MTFGFGLALLLWVLASLLLNGVAFLRLVAKLRGLELLVSGDSAAVASHALFGRSATLGPPCDHPDLGTFHNVDHDWPNVGKLNTNGCFEQFPVNGLALNSLLILGAIISCAGLDDSSVVPLAQPWNPRTQGVPDRAQF